MDKMLKNGDGRKIARFKIGNCCRKASAECGLKDPRECRVHADKALGKEWALGEQRAAS